MSGANGMKFQIGDFAKVKEHEAFTPNILVEIIHVKNERYGIKYVKTAMHSALLWEEKDLFELTKLEKALQ